MSTVIQLWDSVTIEPSIKTCLSTESTFKSYISTPRSTSPTSTIREKIFDNYGDLIHSKSNLSTEAKKTDHLEKPFDFYDDEEFAFGINLLNNNVDCVGDNITKLIQMAQEPWPSNVKLFQPYEVEQILLPDNASCLAVQAFLKMCNLPFEVEMRWNAEFMSPSGRVPFIKCGAFVVSELEPIVQFAANKGVTLCAKISSEEKAEMRAYMSLITNVLVNAELYISWLDNETYNTVTKVRNSSVYPWPLGWLQTRSKRNAVAKRLKALNWHDKTLDQVLADVEQCCNSLSQRLGDKEYFFGTPTPLDALVCAHTRALLSSSGPRAPLLIKCITSALLRHVLTVAKLCKMTLKPQEEYLINQAFQVSLRRRTSPEMTCESDARIRKSKLCIKNASNGTVADNGFKPFASKEIVMKPSEDGSFTCHYEGPPKIVTTQEAVDFITEIIDGIIGKVIEFDDNFEIITHCHGDLKPDRLLDEYLDTIEEVDTTLSLETRGITDDDLHVVNDSDRHVDDSDMNADDRRTNDIDSCFDEINPCVNDIDISFNGTRTLTNTIDDVTESTLEGPNAVTEDEVFKTPLGGSSIKRCPSTPESNSGPKLVSEQPSMLSETSKSLSLTGSNSFMKIQNNDDISVDKILKYLRKRNAVYNYAPNVVDVD